jgi:hypothetical protein
MVRVAGASRGLKLAKCTSNGGVFSFYKELSTNTRKTHSIISFPFRSATVPTQGELHLSEQS